MVDKAGNSKKRKVKRTTNVTDPNEIAINTYNEVSGARKMVKVGPRLTPQGTIADTATSFGAGNGKIIEVYNDTAATLFFLSGDSSVAAPTNAVNGIAVPANSYRTFAMGEDTHLRASAATGLTFYKVDDDTQLVKRNPAN